MGNFNPKMPEDRFNEHALSTGVLYLRSLGPKLHQEETIKQLENKNGPIHEMHATFDEMAKARILYQYRDYCAHKYMDIAKCMRDNFPLVTRCHHETSAWHECQYYEDIHRHKKKERARRILKKRKEKEAMEARQAKVAS